MREVERRRAIELQREKQRQRDIAKRQMDEEKRLQKERDQLRYFFLFPSLKLFLLCPVRV